MPRESVMQNSRGIVFEFLSLTSDNGTQTFIGGVGLDQNPLWVNDKSSQPLVHSERITELNLLRWVGDMELTV